MAHIEDPVGPFTPVAVLIQLNPTPQSGTTPASGLLSGALGETEDLLAILFETTKVVKATPATKNKAAITPNIPFVFLLNSISFLVFSLL